MYILLFEELTILTCHSEVFHSFEVFTEPILQ